MTVQMNASVDKNGKYIIAAENLTFRYQGRAVLDNLSLHVEKGEHVGIVGESGCGKSTLLKLLAGLITPQEGDLVVAGESAPERIIRKISMVMQEPQLMPLTIYENITLGHEISEARMNEIIRAARLEEWVSSLEKGIHTYLGNSANELSGGQAQRIAVARAMAKEAEIILLDEPTSALDSATGEKLMEALEELTAGKTVIHVSHQLRMLKNYDRVLHMEQGRILNT